MFYQSSNISSFYPSRPVEMHISLFQRCQSFLDDVVDGFKELFQFLPCIYDLHDNGHILRETLDLEGMQSTMCPIPHHSTENCRSCEMALSCLQHKPFVQGLTLVSIAFPNENPQ